MKIASIFILLTTACAVSFDISAQENPNFPRGNQTGEQLQAGKLTGRIIDAQKKAIPYATVTLLRKDSTVVNGNLTDDNGNFSIEPTGIGFFNLQVSGIGIKTRTIKNIH